MSLTEIQRKIVALSLVPRMGPRTFADYVQALGGVDGALAADEKDWASVKVKNKIAHQELRSPDLFRRADQEIEKARKCSVSILTQEHEEYPGLLREIFDPPPVLYVKGKLPPHSLPHIAVVGSRQCSLYGRRMTARIVEDLSLAGAVIVSGLAMGIDTVAHESALKAGGFTIAVLGGGIGRLYPKENTNLAEKIASQGAVISEHPVDMTPKPAYFPIRNRIISGLSLAVLVAEARAKSGALITADSALEQNREVFALPGNADSAGSLGSNALLKQGAKFITGADDIMESLGFSGRIKPRAKIAESAEKNLGQEEKKVLACVGDEPVYLDQIVEGSGFSLSKVMGLLLRLEILRLVRPLPGKYFERVNA